MEKIIITLCIGSLGGYVGYKTGFPSGIIMGAMLFVGGYNIFSNNAYIPNFFSVINQVLIGSIVGLSFTINNLKSLSKLVVPAIIIVVGLLVMSVVLGIILNKFTGIDLATSLFSTCPGALNAMAVLTKAYSAESQVVLLFHTLRLIAVVALMPILIELTVKILKFLK